MNFGKECHSIFVNLIGWNFSEDLVVFAMKQRARQITISFNHLSGCVIELFSGFDF